MFKFMFIMMIFINMMNFWSFMYFLLLLMLLLLLFIPYNMFIFNNILMMDNMSFMLVVLTMWIIILMIMSMEKIKIYYKYSDLLVFMIFILLISLICSFIFFNYFYYYIFFEVSLIPVLYLVLGWGYQPERIKAGLYLFFYTLTASLPLLVVLLNLFLNYKSLMMLNNYIMNMNYTYYYYFLMLAFLVKLPMFFFHLWLPKAHVEAPISGSMILAGILLKLGGYGIIRILMYLIKFNMMNILIMIISLWGGLIISMNCLMQFDMKMLIAYSSVSHMSILLSGLLTYSNWGMNGGYLMMIGHGLCSSGLFCLANINYERIMSRSLVFNKGMVNFIPGLSLWWFLLCSSNMSAPLSLNLISEISLIYSLIFFSKINIFFIMFMCFFSASYSIYLYSFSQHGLNNLLIYSFMNFNLREKLLLMFHWLPLNILFLKIFYI